MSPPANENSDTSQPDNWLSLAFAFVGGYGDAAGFLLAKTFTGHVTGNLVLAAIAVVAHDWRATFAHFSAVTCFLAGIPLSVLIARLPGAWPPWPLLTTVVAIEVILILAGYWGVASHAAAGVEILIVCMSLALGLQNGAFRRTGGISVHTNYLTGMLTGLIASKVEKLTLPVSPGRAIAINSKSGLLSGIWAVFVFGAVTGAAAVLKFKESAILGAAFILLAIIVRNSLTARSHATG
jgi:uncharacterized membrane protein YoaK (UPF0700 family)